MCAIKRLCDITINDFTYSNVVKRLMCSLPAAAIISIMLTILMVDAQIVCNENEELDPCGRHCEDRCHNPSPKNDWCTKFQCPKFMEGCRCKDGYARSWPAMDCRRPQKCQ